MSSIFDIPYTKTLDAAFEAANNTNGLYVNSNDGSLLCSHWFSAAFTRKISLADADTVIAKLDEAFTMTERMLEIQIDPTNTPKVNDWVLAALRTQQLFEAAKTKQTSNPLINEIAHRHTFHFHLPAHIKGCAIGLAHVADGPYTLTEARGPNIVGGRYFYKDSFCFLVGFLQMAYIGAMTQLERLASLIIKVAQTVTGIFGISLSSLNRFHYFRNNETNTDIYDTNAIPMPLETNDVGRFSSHWRGHATCLFSIPVVEGDHRSRITILTDPVEEDLQSLLYPRMTNVPCPLEKCPPIHVCMISHNHQDHLSPATLQKLLILDPLIVVPKGDSERLRSMGFSRVIELGWFERVDIQVKDVDDVTYQVGITGVPSNHGSGNTSQGQRLSLFNGYVIQSAGLDGDVYFAGDTARLDADHLQKLRDTFSIKYNFQPGGPDEIRAHQANSHQASCDGIAMHLHLMVGKSYRNLLEQLGTPPSFDQLREVCAQQFTIYMHTKTYKLGNIHFDDTDRSVARVLNWLRTHDNWDEIEASDDLMSYEKEVLSEIAQEEGAHIIIRDSQTPLLPKHIASLLEINHNITIPKIGARFTA